MPFWEEWLFHKRFNDAQPAAAAALWASEGATSRRGWYMMPRLMPRLRLSPCKTRLCQANVLSPPSSLMPPSTQASAQLGWPHQMAMSSKVTGTCVASLSYKTSTKQNCQSSPASSAERILSRDNFLPPSNPWVYSKKKCPKPLSKFLGLQRPWHSGSRWRISCQSSNFDRRNKACANGMSSSKSQLLPFTMRSWKSAPAHKAVLAASQQQSSESQSITHRRKGRSWHFWDKFMAAFWLPVRMAMSSSRAIALGDPLNGSCVSQLHKSSMARVSGVAAASRAAGMAPINPVSEPKSKRASFQSSIQIPCPTGKAQEQSRRVSQSWQPQIPGQEPLLNGPRWWSSKMQPGTPWAANAKAIPRWSNQRHKSNRWTGPHWHSTISLSISWCHFVSRTNIAVLLGFELTLVDLSIMFLLVYRVFILLYHRICQSLWGWMMLTGGAATE